MADPNEDPNSNAGAVFGFFPQFAGKKRTSYATDAALRAGYQVNPAGGFQPAEPALPSAQQALPSDVQPSSAGAGRGSVNPGPGAPPTVAPTTDSGSYDPSVAPQGAGPGRGTANAGFGFNDFTGAKTSPALGTAGGAGLPVDGAAGVRKYVTADGRTLYSNVPGGDSATLMSANPGVQVVPAVGGFQGAGQSSPADVAGINARAAQTYRDIAQLNQGYDQPGALSNGSGAIILSGLTLAKDANNRFNSTPSGSTTGSTGRLQNDLAIAAAHDATLRANNQDTTAASLAGQQMQSDTAAARLGFDQGNSAYTNAERQATTAQTRVQTQAALDLQAAKLAYGKAVASGDAKAIQAAEDGLRAAQGKWEKEIPDLYSATALPAAVGLDGTKVPGGAIITNKRTGETKILTQQDVAPQTPKYETGKVYVDGQGKRAKWDGKQFVPV